MDCTCLHGSWRVLGMGVHISFRKEGENVFPAHACRLQQCSRRMPCLCPCPGFKLGAEESHNHLYFPPQSGVRGSLLSSVSKCHERELDLSLPDCANRLCGECIDGVHQHLCLGGAYPLSPIPPVSAPRLANEIFFTYNLGTYQTAVFVLGWGQ